MTPMKKCLILALSWTALMATAQMPIGPLQTIPTLDLQRYSGQWFEVAKFPNRFQKQCTANTVAQYTPQSDGTVQVVNQCQLADGRTERATGSARQIGGRDSPRLQVRFAPAWLSFMPMVWGDYWVIDLDSDYQLAAVSEPARNYLWILSRQPQVESARYAALLQRLAAQGLDISRLETTAQSAR